MTYQVPLAVFMAALLTASPTLAGKQKECRNTYECCLEKHPQNPEACGAEPGRQPKAKKKKSEKAMEEAL